jgi:hypothetical protein
MALAGEGNLGGRTLPVTQVLAGAAGTPIDDVAVRL